jgi:membrane associated rhomboid family serine protease
MIVIPMGTDAPIYHWPRTTVALIVLNIAAFLAVPPTPPTPPDDNPDEMVESVEPVVTNFDRYALALGNGLHPVQWVTHNFLHYGIMHLAGNMLFLWAFGIVVEGKLGILKYLALYLAIGTLHGAFTQALLLRSGLDGHAAGASAIVYGLLAVCMVWAPRNELNCIAVFLIGFRVLVFHWDLYYTTVALLYIGEQVLGLAIVGGLGGKVAVSEMGHLSGALWGSVLAATMVKANLVDCEGWDLFALWAKRRKLAKAWKERGDALDRQSEHLKSSLKAAKRSKSTKAVAPAEAEPTDQERAALAVGRVQKQIDKGNFAAALSAYDKAARTLVAWPAQTDLYTLIKSMHAQKAEAESIRMMRDYCRYYPEAAATPKIRLKLAQVLIRDRQRPTAALRVLAEVPSGALAGDLEKARQQLTRQAKKMQEEGVLELEGDD